MAFSHQYVSSSSPYPYQLYTSFQPYQYLYPQYQSQLQVFNTASSSINFEPYQHQYMSQWQLDPQAISMASNSNSEPYQYRCEQLYPYQYQSQYWQHDPQVIDTANSSNIESSVQYSNGGIYAQFQDMTIIVDEDGEIIDDYSQFYDEDKMKKDLISREETISKHLKTRTNDLKSKDSESQEQEQEICVICQEEYEEGERIGKVECGHEYHVDCIKKWLLQNTVCPVCKSIALPTKN